MKQKTIDFGPKKDWLKAAKTFARQAYGTARCKDIESARATSTRNPIFGKTNQVKLSTSTKASP